MFLDEVLATDVGTYLCRKYPNRRMNLVSLPRGCGTETLRHKLRHRQWKQVYKLEKKRDSILSGAGTEFTSFTGTKVQILTQVGEG